MANTTIADANGSGTHTVDCGYAGFYHIENFSGTDGQVVVDGAARLANQKSIVSGWCTGSTTFAGTNSTGVYAVITKLDFPIAEALMGLAGIICALLITKAFLR